jgi:hypothetical protein
MKRLVFVLILSGCAHPYLKSWNQSNGEYSVCCSKKSCDQNEVSSFANSKCSGAVELVGGSVEGASSAIMVNGSWMPVNIRQSCKTYKCNGTIFTSE